MNKCLYCYKKLGEREIDYHPKCSKLFYGTEKPPVLPYRLDEMEFLARESVQHSITVPGVQPKLSLGWIKNLLTDGQRGRLTILDALEGNYILKPQNVLYSQMPENEHLSMKLAELFNIKTVPYAMIRLITGELCYITKRIDRNVDGSKNHMIDFLQILELENKYKGSMELVGNMIGKLSNHTLLDKRRFFELTVFNFIIGNNDMHLKNFSMLNDSSLGWVFSPAYDLLNVKIIFPKDKEDTALLLGGKKMNFSKGYFNRLAEVLGLNDKQVKTVYKRILEWNPKALQLIDISFLNGDNKSAFKTLVEERASLFL
ncbi:HipA domain-containing protein [Sphingobacterium kitahiroshimense]|uniref:HipA domain-containing protein n=1 Tax=Sphingobacterium kitahiroshimense TaxID=470446 RepID=A0ABV0BP97_9SPHI